jgi:hypothetical protein
MTKGDGEILSLSISGGECSPPQHFLSSTLFLTVSIRSSQIIANMASNTETEKVSQPNETIPISVEFT